MKRIKLPERAGLGLEIKQVPGKGLGGHFLVPPFSVLNTREGGWQKRKKQWLALGIKSEVGRVGPPGGSPRPACDYSKSGARGDGYGKAILGTEKAGLLHKGRTINTRKGEKRDGGRSAWQNEGVSVFDPALCELMYAWFCPPSGQIIDPFAGGSVRGIVAIYMGHRYWGCELRPEQVSANMEQAERITPQNPPVWVCGDSRRELRNAPEADFLFSCPPYGNLEVYSTLEGDISNLPDYSSFLSAYRAIIKKACKKLKSNRFACFVVSNFRDKKTGFYYDFVGDTIRIFEEFGTHFYNEMVLVNAIGSLPVRVGRQFDASRKIGKTHQNVLVFYKGDPKKIKETQNENQQN